MVNYKHVLITTDLSPQSEQIFNQAFAFTKHAQPKISVVHVVEHTPVVYGGGEFSIPLDINLEEVLTNNAKQALAQLAKKLSISAENQYVETGSVKTAVADLAKKLHADLIIVGTHSRHGIQKLLGATANAILHAAPCDVLTIRVQD